MQQPTAFRYGGSVSVVAVDGTAGLGKTARVVCAAHEIRRHYPDGCLFVDLRHSMRGQKFSPPSSAMRWNSARQTMPVGPPRCRLGRAYLKAGRVAEEHEQCRAAQAIERREDRA
ncbi:hypothetical protein [Streptomyces sp. NPDC086519]|uniref:hypothetical protein n=1 Tax=Streptomyces sp. NPDC086519 TaxID=3154863 RepID=UPI00343F95DE